MSEQYEERFPGAGMLGGFIAFCMMFGICCLVDPNFTNFNDEDGMKDFIWVICAFIVFTFGSSRFFKEGD